jgi:hypothetical protein
LLGLAFQLAQALKVQIRIGRGACW